MYNNNENGPNNQNNNPRNNNRLFGFLTILLIMLVIVTVGDGLFKSTVDQKHIKYSEFMDMVKNDKVSNVQLTDGRIIIYPKGDKNELIKKSFVTANIGDKRLYEQLDEHHVAYDAKLTDPTRDLLFRILGFLSYIIIGYAIFALMMRKMGSGSGGIFGVGKAGAKAYVQKDTGVAFKDVAGEDEAKESLQEVVDFLENPTKYTQIGAKLPKGVLLVGPPGTGKTLLAKALAGEANVPFYSLTGSSFVEMFVGVGASRVRDLFEEAKKNAPCIIFIDEIDAIGKSRDTGGYGGGNDEREQTLNQLLSEMDGFDSSKACLVIAATNRPEVLDPALLRPGRFDRRVIVDAPDLKGRKEILKVHAANVLLDDTVNFDEIALATSGAVGSDLANMVNEAAILAVKANRRSVTQKDLFDSVELVLVGKEKKNKILSIKERRIVSYHEVGHALVNALQKDAEPVQKITIVPRTMGSLGYVLQVPEEEKCLNTKEELQALIVGFLGGRAAEEVVFNTATTGAVNDIEKATGIAKSMVTLYGMSDKFGLMGLGKVENQYLSGKTVLNCSDRTEAEVDEEVKRILEDSYAKAKKLLMDNRKAMDRIAEFLIEKETITGKEFMEILREVQKEEKEADNSVNKTSSTTKKSKKEIETDLNDTEDAVLENEKIEVTENEDNSKAEKPKRKYTRRKKVEEIDELDALQISFDELNNDSIDEDKTPKKKTTRKKKADSSDTEEEKPKRKYVRKKKTEASDENAEKPKKKARRSSDEGEDA